MNIIRRIAIRTKRLIANSVGVRRIASKLWPYGRVVRVQRGPLRNILLRVPAFAGGAHYASADYEQHEVQLVLRLAVSAGVQWFCDVGAHVGYYSLLIDRAMNGKCCIHAFEPTNAAFTCLASNLAYNCKGRFRIYREAVADESGIQQFVGQGGDVASGLKKHRPRTWSNLTGDKQDVQVVTLDEALPVSRSVGHGLVKVDVEGAELAVLDGAYRLLTEMRPTWIIECHGARAKDQVWDRMIKANYRCYLLSPDAGHVAFPHVIAIPHEMTDKLSDLCAELSSEKSPEV